MEDYWSLWKDASGEIFRLQLLNRYDVEPERQMFDTYQRVGKVDLSENQGFNNWLGKIKDKLDHGVRVINLNVVDLPLSEYMKFCIASYLIKRSEIGEEGLLIDRSIVSDIVKGNSDFIMFDRKVALEMLYDNNGRFLGTGRITRDLDTIARYVRLEEQLLRVATPIPLFIASKGISLAPSTSVKI